ncbi:hypothetical protein [Panacagrimonas sp.]|uniref:hypothetical protein n=1 Tax=Panacagrimonas sp. TaxID=2480088 RepID=UPI003B517E5E
MYHILYEHDHANRAKALDDNQGRAQLVQDPVVKVAGLKTLILWGHGNSGLFCNLSPGDLADKVKEWKSKNSGIDSVEILTCNSRHAKAGTEPYVDQFKHKLGFFTRRKLTIKSLPVRMGVNGVNGDSILFADYKSKTWCYLTSSESTFHYAKNVFKSVCENMFGDDAIDAAAYLTNTPPHDIRKDALGNAKVGQFLIKCKVNKVEELHASGTVHGWTNVDKFMTDFREMLSIPSFRRAFVTSRPFTLNYGTFDYLRKSLVAV